MANINFVDDRSYEEDALVLRVIESYCTSAKTRSTISSGESHSISKLCLGSSVFLPYRIVIYLNVYSAWHFDFVQQSRLVAYFIYQWVY